MKLRLLSLVAGSAILLAKSAVAVPAAPLLGGPEVAKLDWNSKGVLAADLNGDGRNDLALINNDRARIELLLQRAPGEIGKPSARRVQTSRWEPEVEDSRFERHPITAGITVHDLAAGDLNGDGRIDLAYTGDPDVLTVRYQSAAGEWDEKKVLDLGRPLQFLTTLKIADLNGDKRSDLLVLLQKELVVIRQDAKGALGSPERFAIADENCFSLDVVDLDGDGRLDVSYIAPSRRDALRVRFQQPDGTLGPEVPFQIETPKGSLQIVSRGPGKTAALGYVQNLTGSLSVVALETEPAPGKGKTPVAGVPELKPRVYSTRTGAKTPPGYALGDIDGDGRTDLAVTDADGAQVLVYFQSANGELSEAKPFPSLTDGRAIAAADWDGDGRAELFIASPKEQTLGEARFTKTGRLSYPQPLPIKGKPLALDATVMKEKQPPVLAVALEEGGKRRVDLLARRGEATEVVTSIELANLRTDPRAVRFVDANQDGRPDLAVFIPFEPMRLLVQDAEGKFTDLSTQTGYRKGLVDNLDPAALTVVDIDGDGKREMLVGGTGFARVLKLDETNTLQVADQFNARETGTEIAAALAADLDGDGQREVLLLDRRGDQVQVLKRNPQGVYAFADAVPVGRIELVGAVQTDLNRDGRDDLLFLGKDRFWSIPLGRADRKAAVLLNYETDLKDVTYGDVTVGDLNNDKQSDFVMVDPRRNLVEVLTRDGMEAHSALHFLVFEADPHAQRKGNSTFEPRETLVADVTGDGKADLVLLVHDRVLVYPQK